MIKPSIFFCCCFLLMQPAVAQKNDPSFRPSSPVKYGQLIQQQKKNKTAAWILCGTGIALMAAGTYIYTLHKLESDTRSATSADELLFYSGAVATLASIPFFISAGKQKREARLALINEPSTMVSKTFATFNHTAIGLKVYF